MQPDGPELRQHGQLTVLLRAWQHGDKDAEQKLIELVYAQLHAMAVGQMRRERRDHTLCPTELVHEAWLRLDDLQMDLNDRSHFLALAATAMRRILIDHARTRCRQKRSGGLQKISFDEAKLTVAMESEIALEQLIDLDRALTGLSQQDPRKGRLMELIYFGGLTTEESAIVLSSTVRTVERDIKFSKAWMKAALSGGSALPA